MKILIVLIKSGKIEVSGVGRVINSIKPLLEKKGHQVEAHRFAEKESNINSVASNYLGTYKKLK